MSNHTTLHEVYKTAFQPDPDVRIPNAFPIPYHPLNNARVVSTPTLVNAPFGNCSADYLALNPTQFASLHHLIGNVADVYTLAYFISTELPPPGSNPDSAKLVLPTRLLPDDARRITSPIPFALYPRNEHVSSPSPFLAGYYGFYDDFVRTSQIVNTPSPAVLLTPLPSPALVPATNIKANEVDRTRSIKREESIKQEEEQDLRHKEIAIRVKDAIGTWVHACQRNKATNASTGIDKPAPFKQETKSLPDVTNRRPTIALLTNKEPFIPETTTPLSPLSIPALSPFTSHAGVSRTTTRHWERQMMKPVYRGPPSTTTTRKTIWNPLAALARTTQHRTLASSQIPSALAVTVFLSSLYSL